MQWSHEVENSIKVLLEIKDSRKIAVFDADGTLWHDDLGEAFFKYQIEKKLAPGIKGILDPWKYYRELDQVDTAVSSAWLVKISAGVREQTLKQNCHEFYRDHFVNKPAEPLKALIKRFHQAKFEVWICTASPRWSIEPCLAELEIPANRLIGTEAEIDSSGVITDKIVYPVPYTTGKRFWLEKKLRQAPQFVAGNSRGDFEMMSYASKLALGIVFLPHLEVIRNGQELLITEAQKRNWPIQYFGKK